MTEGFATISELISADETDALIQALATLASPGAVRTRGGVFAIRNLLDISPAVRDLALSAPLLHLVESCIGPGAFPVRALLFDKTPAANWLVPWHQDLTIPVRRRIDAPGYTAWSVKAGVVHVQPPVEVLESMLAVRIHLDDCDESNGALRVLPGTHQFGKIDPGKEAQLHAAIAPVICRVPRGGAILMKPLLLHSSSAGTRPAHRRVIHIEYAACELSPGLEWHCTRPPKEM